MTRRLLFLQPISIFVSSRVPHNSLSVNHASFLRFLSDIKTWTCFLQTLFFSIFSSLPIFPSGLTFPFLYIFLSLVQSVSTMFLSYLRLSLSRCFFICLCSSVSIYVASLHQLLSLQSPFQFVFGGTGFLLLVFLPSVRPSLILYI